MHDLLFLTPLPPPVEVATPGLSRRVRGGASGPYLTEVIGAPSTVNVFLEASGFLVGRSCRATDSRGGVKIYLNLHHLIEVFSTGENECF